MCSFALVVIALGNGSLIGYLTLTYFTNIFSLICAIVAGMYFVVTGFRVVKYLSTAILGNLQKQLRRVEISLKFRNMCF